MSRFVTERTLESARAISNQARERAHWISFEARDAASMIWAAFYYHYQQGWHGSATYDFLDCSHHFLCRAVDVALAGGRTAHDRAAIEGLVEQFLAVLVYEDANGDTHTHRSLSSVLAATWATMQVLLTRAAEPLPQRWLNVVGGRVDLCALIDGCRDDWCELARALERFADAMEASADARFVLRSDKGKYLSCADDRYRSIRPVCSVCDSYQEDSDTRRYVSLEVATAFGLLLWARECCEDEEEEADQVRVALMRCVRLVDWVQSDDRLASAILSALANHYINLIANRQLDKCDKHFGGMMEPIAQEFLPLLCSLCCYGDVLAAGFVVDSPIERFWRIALRASGICGKRCSRDAIELYKHGQQQGH